MTLDQKIDGYCIRAANGKYIGLDSASGGYPYIPNDIVNIHVWRTQEEAEKYKQILSSSGSFGDVGSVSAWRVRHIVLLEVDE